MRPLTIGLMAAVAWLTAGCDSLSHHAAGEPLPGTREALAVQPEDGIKRKALWQGDQAKRAEPAFITARTEGEWQALWANIGQPEPGDLPDRTMAVAIMLGQRPTGGYAASVEDWSVATLPGIGQALVLRWREKVPPPDAVVTQAVSTPWTVRLLRAVDGPVHFTKID